MKYIKPEIEINMIHTEDVITSSVLSFIVNKGAEGAAAPSVTENSGTEATVNVGADFFG